MLQDKEPKTTHTNPHLDNIRIILKYATNEELIKTVSNSDPNDIDPTWAAYVAHSVQYPLNTKNDKDKT